MRPGVRDLRLDRATAHEEEGEALLRRYEAEYGARVGARKAALMRWVAEETVREEERRRLRRGALAPGELARIRARRAAEDARRDAELAGWDLENAAAVARLRRAPSGAGEVIRD